MLASQFLVFLQFSLFSMLKPLINNEANSIQIRLRNLLTGGTGVATGKTVQPAIRQMQLVVFASLDCDRSVVFLRSLFIAEMWYFDNFCEAYVSQIKSCSAPLMLFYTIRNRHECSHIEKKRKKIGKQIKFMFFGLIGDCDMLDPANSKTCLRFCATALSLTWRKQRFRKVCRKVLRHFWGRDE